MITYKNTSFSAKTFYGVRFEPGETKSVPGFINNSCMVRVFTAKPKTKSENPKLFDVPAPKRGRKPKSTETEKVEVAETNEIIKEISEEETTNGNPS